MSMIAIASMKNNKGRSFDSPVKYACRIFGNVIFVYGQLRHSITGKESILIDGVSAERPYLAAVLNKSIANSVAMILRTNDGKVPDSLNEVTLLHHGGTANWRFSGELDEKAKNFEEFLDELHESDLIKVLLLLIKFSGIDARAPNNEQYSQICGTIRKRLEPSNRKVPTAFWLLPNVLYMEANIPNQEYSKSRLIVNSSYAVKAAVIEVMSAPCESAANNHSRYPMLITFNAPSAKLVRDGSISIMVKDQIIPLQPVSAPVENGVASFISHLSTLPETVRFNIRDFVNHTLIESSTKSTKSEAANLVSSLQLYVIPTHTSVFEQDNPFGMNIETIFPLGNRGILISGWIYDPLDMADTISLNSDLGFSLSIGKQRLLHFPRSDVSKLYKDSRFFKREEEWGFVTLLEFPHELSERLAGWPESFSFRFSITLKGGLRYKISPKAEPFDPGTARENLLNQLTCWINPSSPAALVISKALSLIQNSYSKKISIKNTVHFGKQREKPKVSVVVPLYKSFEYIQCQIAQFANDTAMLQAEVIYVLDNPEQERTLTKKLRELSSLYNFPISLITLSENSGYSSAVNLGVSKARAEHLLLMHSDVLPKSSGWLNKIIKAYAEKSPTVGAITPKLIYEDGGIQHAGIYFEEDISETYFETVCYYKGYPANFSEACVSRDVPAISTACMYIRKSLFDKVGGLTSDYVTSGFEDSDLCLKLNKEGHRSYFLAYVELYHFERKSIDLSKEAQSADSWINATIHNDRWKKTITQIMRDYV